MIEQAAFGIELRRARERRGLTLEAIAEQTKVSVTHFAGLERADLSRWPSGIFRRAFVRSYALAVGLDPEETVTCFSRLFPDPAERPAPITSSNGRPAHATEPAPLAPAAQDDEPGLRLALERAAVPERPRLPPVVRRLLAGVIDVSAAIVPAALVALAAGVYWFWPVVACVALSGHLACYASLGTTPGAWLVGRLTAAPVVVPSPRIERRRGDGELAPAPRRRVTRPAPSRPGRAHRVRH